jgi:glycosyltransferase involved in cell wall biosynthesis
MNVSENSFVLDEKVASHSIVPVIAGAADIVLLERTATRLTIVNQFFPPDYAATGQLIEELAHELKGKFNQVEVFSSQPSYAFRRNDLPRWEHHQHLGIRRSQASSVGAGRIRGKAVSGAIFFVRTALHLIRHASPHQLVLLTTAPPFLPLLGYFVNIFRRMSYVCLLYDLYPDIAIELKVVKRHSWIVKLWDFFNCLAWKKASAIIVLSSSMKNRIVKKCPKVAHKVFVIPSWCDSQQIQPLPKAENWFAQEHNLVDRFTVLYSGNMGRCHDMMTLVGAMDLLRETPIQFVFIGSGEKRQYVENCAKEMNLKNCLFLPYQSKEDLPFSLTACDLSIVSIDEQMEGLVAPSKLYSALAAGAPVAAICPDNSYLSEVLDQAGCGSTFRNGDSQGLATYINMLSSNSDLVNQMGQSGRQFCVENYSRRRITQQYFNLLASSI